MWKLLEIVKHIFTWKLFDINQAQAKMIRLWPL